MNEIKFAKLSRFQCVLLTSKNMRRPAHPSSKYSLQTRKCMNFFFKLYFVISLWPLLTLLTKQWVLFSEI